MPSIEVELALEQLNEDGTLTADLDDQAGSALLHWAEQQLVAADPVEDSAAFAAHVAAVRSAVRRAARGGSRSGEYSSPEQVVSDAAALLSQSSAARAVLAAAATDAQSVTVNHAAGAHIMPASPLSTGSPALAERRFGWSSLRRRLRRWTHLKA